MPIIKVGTTVTRVPALNFDEFLQTAVVRSDQFALCDQFDRLKQMQFDVHLQNTQTILTLQSPNILSNTTITLPASSGTLTTTAFGIVQPITGTSPTATVATDTLTFTSSDSSVTIIGNSSTNTIDFKSGGGGGGGTWGSITGTLSNQTDLQSALNAKQNTLTTGNLTIPTNPNISISGGTGAVIGSGTALSLTGASIVEATSSVLILTGATNAVLGTGVSIQVKDAAADGSTKGAAAFNSTNFTASAGVVNTIQDITTSSDVNFNSITINSGAGIASDGRLFTPEWNFPPGSTTTGPGVSFTQDGFASFIGNQIIFDTSETVTGDHNPTINVAASTDNALVVSGTLYVANQFNAAHGGFTVDSDGNMYAAGQLVTNGDGVNVFSNLFVDANVYDGNQVALWTPSNRTFQDLNGQDALTVDDGSQNTVFAPAGITRVHSQNLDGPTFFIDAPSLNAGANAFQVSIDSTISAAIDDQGNTSLAGGQIQANADGSRFQLGNPASGVGIGYGGGQFFIQTTGSGLVIGDYEGSGNGTKMVFSDGVGVIEAIVPGQFVVTGPLHVTGTSTLVDANMSGTLNISGLTTSQLVGTDSSRNIISVPSPTVTHLVSTGTAPTIAAGTGAGTSPTVSIAGHDLAGAVSVTTGTIPTGTNAIVATITFGTTFGAAPYPVIYPANAATATLSGVSMVFVTSTTTTFVITSGTTALTAATTYKWNYHVIQ